jgi:hypothetical protein
MFSTTPSTGTPVLDFLHLALFDGLDVLPLVFSLFLAVTLDKLLE